MKNLNIISSFFRYLSFALLILLISACSDFKDQGIYALMTETPDSLGRFTGSLYLYPIEDLNLSIEDLNLSIEVEELNKIYENYDKKAKKGQSTINLL